MCRLVEENFRSQPTSLMGKELCYSDVKAGEFRTCDTISVYYTVLAKNCLKKHNQNNDSCVIACREMTMETLQVLIYHCIGLQVCSISTHNGTPIRDNFKLTSVRSMQKVVDATTKTPNHHDQSPALHQSHGLALPPLLSVLSIEANSSSFLSTFQQEHDCLHAPLVLLNSS